ncbi:MAG: choice-of-anchor D domain-containing protein [Ignavibacteria bacterium]|nr:choice-of-anchor D domain-containing protein [Ignavibacteria bacterium]
MKRYDRSIAQFIRLFGGLDAPPPFAPPPEFSPSRTTVQLGTVDTRLGKRDTVRVANRGAGLLYVTRVRSGHPDCRVFSSSADTVAILPGASASTPSSSIRYTGPVSFPVTFDHNAPNHTDSVLVTATVTGDTLTPRLSGDLRPLNFGTAQTGETKKDTIILLNLGRPTLYVDMSMPKQWSVPEGRVSIYDNGFARVIVSFMSLTPGAFHGWLVLRHNGDFGAMRTDSVALTGVAVGDTLAPKFSVMRTLLDFGSLAVGQTRSDTLTVRNVGNYALTVSPPVPLEVSYSVLPRNDITILPGDVGMFTVTFAPKSMGNKRSALRFYLGGGRIDSLQLRGLCDSGLDEAVLELSADTLALRNVKVDSLRQATLRLRNIGRQQLVISRIAVAHPWLSVAPDSMMLEQLGEATVLVTFSPRDTGAMNTALVIESNTAAGRDSVTVTGRGIRLLSIRDARSAPPGAVVTFEGSVTRHKGSMARMQDGTAAIALRVGAGRLKQDLDRNALDYCILRIVGRVSEQHALTIVDSGDIVDHDVIPTRQQDLSYVQLTLADIARDGERYESALIRIYPIVVENQEGIWRASTTYRITGPGDSAHAVVLHVPDSADSDFAGSRRYFGGIESYCGVLSQYSDGNPRAGYMLVPVWHWDLSNSTLPVDDVAPLPRDVHIAAYPNPVSSAATVHFALPVAGFVQLDVHNALGVRVGALLRGHTSPGEHHVAWPGFDDASRRLPPGVYFLTLAVQPDAGGPPSRVAAKVLRQ